MRCADASAVMMQVLDGLATPAQREALLAHTAGCATCLAEWQAIQKLDTLLATAPMVSPPAGFTERVLARLPHSLPSMSLPSDEPRRESGAGNGQLRPRGRSVLAEARPWQVRDAREVNPWGGLAALLIGTLLISAFLAFPLLSRTWPSLWAALTAPETLSSSLVGGTQLATGISETLQTVWHLQYPLLRSVSPLLLLTYLLLYLTLAFAIVLVWLRLVAGTQQGLHLRR